MLVGQVRNEHGDLRFTFSATGEPGSNDWCDVRDVSIVLGREVAEMGFAELHGELFMPWRD